MNMSDETQDAYSACCAPKITPLANTMMESPGQSPTLNTNDKHQRGNGSPPEIAPPLDEMISKLSFDSLPIFSIETIKFADSHASLSPSSVRDGLATPKSIGDALTPRSVRSPSSVSTGSISELLKDTSDHVFFSMTPKCIGDALTSRTTMGLPFLSTGSTSELLKDKCDHVLLPPSNIGDTMKPKIIGDALTPRSSMSLSFVSTKSGLLENDSFYISEDNLAKKEQVGEEEDVLAGVGDNKVETVWKRGSASSTKITSCNHTDPDQEPGNVATTSLRVDPGKRPAGVPQLSNAKRAKRQLRKWTAAENKRLEEGVQKYGEGNWSPIAKYVGGNRDNRSCRQKWVLNVRPDIKGSKKSGAWSKEETEQLRQILSSLDDKDPNRWEKASKAMGYTRNMKQIKGRYENFLAPNLRLSVWTKEEDETLLSLQSKHGNKWTRFQSTLIGRSSERIRRRFTFLSKNLNAKK